MKCIKNKICLNFPKECEKCNAISDIYNPYPYLKDKELVEVVRCPDCIYCENMKCTELKDNSGHDLDVAIFDYCSQGIRK